MKNVSTSDIVEIVPKFSDFINGICHKYFIIGGTKEDLYEEGIIGLLEACKNYNGESLFEPRFESFAKLCIKRQIFDAIKKANTQKNKALNEAISFVNISIGNEEQTVLDVWSDRTTSNDPLDLFLDKEKFYERIKHCEKQLSLLEKEVLSHYLNGEKQSEIAMFLGKDVKSIDNTIQRIKAKLK
jgi:RNA polymerase sporulation-specific sigma factor